MTTARKRRPLGALNLLALALCLLGGIPAGCRTPMAAAPLPKSVTDTDIAAQEALLRAATHEYAQRRLLAAREAIADGDYAKALVICGDLLNAVHGGPHTDPLIDAARRLQADAYYYQARQLYRLGRPMEALSLARLSEHMDHPQAKDLVASILKRMESRR